MDAPPPETWPIYDERAVVAALDAALRPRGFERQPPRLIPMSDAIESAPDRIVASWVRWRPFPGDYERAMRDQAPDTADTAVVWADGRVTFDALGHRATFSRWPASWTMVAVTAVLDHLQDRAPL
jgi:hypothetical protein